MPRIDCFKQFRPDLEKKFSANLTKGMDEVHASREVVIEEYRILLKKINDIRKEAGLPLQSSPVFDTKAIDDQFKTIPTKQEEPTKPIEETKTEEPTLTEEQKPAEVQVEKRKTFKNVKPLPPTRIVSNAVEERMTPEDLEVFKKWHQANVPGIPFEVLNNIVITHDNKKAWGVFENGVAKFYKSAARGTEYHEIFEAIYGSFLTQEEQQLLLEEFKSNVGTFLDRETNKRIEYSQATDNQAKERIADDFADFRLGKIKAKSLGERILDFFRNIIDFFKSFVQKPSMKDKLFKQIDKGKFKNETPIVSSKAEYSIIPGLSEQEVNEFVQDITIRSMDIMFGTDQDLFNIKDITSPEIFEPIRELYTEAGYIDDLDPDVLSNAQFDDLVKRTKEFLFSTFTVQFNEEGEASINEEEKDQTLYAPEAFTVDFKKSSPYAIKILVGTLPDKNINNENGTLGLLSFSRAFATLMDRLSNNTDVTQFTKKFVDLVKEDSNYLKLFKRLGGNVNTWTIDTSQFDYTKWRLFTQFYQTFSKQNPKAYIQYMNNGSVYTAEANTFTAVKQLKDSWMANLRLLAQEKDGLVTYNKSDRTYKVKDLKEYPITATKDNTALENIEKFLNAIGIEFEIPVIERLSNSDINKFNKKVSSIHTYLNKNKDIMSITGENLTIDGSLTALAELYTRTTNPNQDLSYFGLDGKRRQAQSENNTASILENDFNSVKTLDELLTIRPELQDIFSRNSQILKKGGLYFGEDGERTAKHLKVAYIQGQENLDNGKSTTQSNLSTGDRFTIELNQNLKGNYYILLPADSSTEWEMEMGNTISYEDIQEGSAWDKIYTAFKGYLIDDINLSKTDRSYLRNVGDKGKELRFFKDILSPKILEGIDSKLDQPIEDITSYLNDNISEINTSIREYIDKYNLSTLAILKNNNQIVNGKKDTYIYENLDNDYIVSNKIDKYAITEKELNDTLVFANINYIINNIELHKILFGDPYQFAIDKKGGLDETKRVKSFLSPRKTLFDSIELNNFLNKSFNTVNGIQLEEGTPGYHNHKSYTNTVTLKDIEVKGSISDNEKVPKSIRDAYADTNETDAFSLIMDGTYREVNIKDGKWDENAEDFHQWHMAYTRLHMPGYEYASSKLQELDIERVAKPIPNYVTSVLKPIATGNKHSVNHIDNVLDKMSQMPIYYHMVESTDLEKTYIQMFKQNIGYGVFESGRKVGIEETHSLYNENGSYNDSNFENIIQVPWKAYGVQQETAYDKPKQQTRGTQVTKLISLDLADNGVFSSERARDLYERNVMLLNTMNVNSYRNLLDDLGIEDNGDVFILSDKPTTAQLLRRELLRREASENLKATLELDENGEWKIPFEASSSYIQIRDILYSKVDKAILSPKMSGSSHVQVSSALWEKSGKGRTVVEVNGKKVFTSSDLKFYTEKDKYMEVLLPAWFKQKLSSSKFKTDEDILNYLNRSEEGKEILKGIGFRIPTQSLSSIENIRVKGFLPEYMGTTVVVPSEITVKAGSDFDIDKLNMYLKAVFVDQNNDLRLVKYMGSEEATKEHYSKVFDKKRANRVFKKAEIVEAIQLLQLGKEIASTADTKGLIPKYANLLNELINSDEDLQERANILLEDISRLSDEQIQAEEKENFVKEMYKGALENEYYMNLDQILSLPENFERLLTPVGKAGLDKLAEKLDELKDNQDNKAKNKILNRNYLTRLRHAFVTGKKWVGIAAVNITGHSLSQKSEVFIDTTKFENLSEFDQKILGDGSVVLPHNETSNYEISMSRKKTYDDKEFISDRLSGYATAFVDIAKDPYILKVIQSELVIGTFMFLERIGTGTNAALFMNQPIIEAYVKHLDSHNKRGIYNKTELDFIKKQFPITPKALQDSKIEVSQLSDNIKKYHSSEKLTIAENAVQHKILNEFLKYSKMAEYSFKLTQASNYDTTRYRSYAQLYKKQALTVDARENNIFSSVDNLLDSSHIGAQSTLLELSAQATSQILKLDQPAFTKYITPILDKFALRNYFSNDAYAKVANKAILSFLDFIVQTKANPRLNTQISALLVNTETAVANQLLEAKQKYPNNRILKELEVANSPVPQSAQSMKLNTNLKNVYDQNIHTEMFRELKELLPELYNNIVKLSLLQGVGQTSISFSDVIPLEDRAAVITPIINTLVPSEDLSAFYKGAFYRNNWKDPNIFHNMEPRFNYQYDNRGLPMDYPIGQDMFGADIFQYQSFAFPSTGLVKSLGIKSSDRKIMELTDTYDSFHIQHDYLLVPRVVKVKATGDKIDIFNGRTITKSMFKQRSLRGDMSLREKIGYEKVRDDLGNPVTYIDKEGNTKYIYKMINLWGDGQYASEYYGGPRQSVLNNGTVKIETEIPTADIIKYFEPKSKEVVSTPTPIVEQEVESSREFVMRMKEIGMFNSQGKVEDLRLDLEMPTKDINKALNDIERYNFGTKPAIRLIEKMEAMRKTGMFNLIQGTGGILERTQQEIPPREEGTDKIPCIE